MHADGPWLKERESWLAKRPHVRAEICELLQRFRAGTVDLEEFRATFDRKTRVEWESFGLKGMSGAMFLNQLVKHIPDQRELAELLRSALALPADVESGRLVLITFRDYLERLIDVATVDRQRTSPARVPFFLSAFWHLQADRAWPVYYPTARSILEMEEAYSEGRDPVTDYFAFRSAYIDLSAALDLGVWDLETLCLWVKERREKIGASIATSEPVVPAAPDPVPAPLAPTVSVHTQSQFLLAKLGLKLGCKVWIAENDRAKTWGGETLGSLSIDRLPPLGLGDDAQRTIRLIDVLWLKAGSQVVSAFEIESTTSIYSGLLRMSDLLMQVPHLNISLYIAAPEERISEVRRQLLRPTFQTLELHKKCGFFSCEALAREAPVIEKWANSPAAIDKLANWVRDTGEEGGAEPAF